VIQALQDHKAILERPVMLGLPDPKEFKAYRAYREIKVQLVHREIKDSPAKLVLLVRRAKQELLAIRAQQVHKAILV
jgi:hypothetical protein